MSELERKFLHDLATPITIAHGSAESALEILLSSGSNAQDAISRLEKSVKALERISNMIRDRREQIILAASSDKDSA